jgi:NADPH:quinone reductase-like Zn-dependent oxidoreductase
MAGRLAIKEVEAPQAGPSEALVQVEAISLNRGEVKHAMETEAGWRPGWDLAGTVIKQAANCTGPKVGSRVVGMIADAYIRVDRGAWAEQVAVPTAEIHSSSGGNLACCWTHCTTCS